MPLSISDRAQAQWTHGNKKIVADILFNGIYLIQGLCTEKRVRKNKEQFMANGKDVTPLYDKVLSNINQFFTPGGSSRLVSSTLKDRGRPLDYSALIGAYYRSKTIGSDGQPLCILNDEQRASIYAFVSEHLMPQDLEVDKTKFTPEMFLNSFKGSKPAEQHKEFLKFMLFKGLSAEEQASMFDKKNKNQADALIDSMLQAADLISTPFAVLDEESENAVQVAKSETAKRHAAGTLAVTSLIDPAISAPDLQTSTAKKSIIGAMDLLLESGKKKKDLPQVKQSQEDLKKFMGEFDATVGVENSAYKLKTQFTRQNKELLDLAKSLEGMDANQVEQYTAQIRATLIQGGADKEVVDKTQLTGLVNLLLDQWRVAYNTQQQQFEVLSKQWADAFQAMQQQNTELTTQLTTAREEISLLEADKQGLVQEIEQVRTEIAALRGKLAQTETQVTEQQKQIELLTVERDQLKQAASTPAKIEPQRTATPADEQELQAARIEARAALKELMKAAKDDPLIDYCHEHLEHFSSKNAEELRSLTSDVVALTVFTQVVNQIADTHEVSAHWYTRGHKDKASAIRGAVAEIPVEKRLSLANDSTWESNLKDESHEEYPGIKKFFDALSIQRSLVFKTKETTSFKAYREAMHQFHHPKEEEETLDQTSNLGSNKGV